MYRASCATMAVTKDRLPGQEVYLAEKSIRAVADDLVSRAVQNRDLALDDRDERVARIAHAVEHLAGLRRPLLADPGQGPKL